MTDLIQKTVWISSQWFTYTKYGQTMKKIGYRNAAVIISSKFCPMIFVLIFVRLISHVHLDIFDTYIERANA